METTLTENVMLTINTWLTLNCVKYLIKYVHGNTTIYNTNSNKNLLNFSIQYSWNKVNILMLLILKITLNYWRNISRISQKLTILLYFKILENFWKLPVHIFSWKAMTRSIEFGFKGQIHVIGLSILWFWVIGIDWIKIGIDFIQWS